MPTKDPLARPPLRDIDRSQVAVWVLGPLIGLGLAGLGLSMAADPKGVDGSSVVVSLAAISALGAAMLLAHHGRPTSGIVLAVIAMEVALWFLVSTGPAEEHAVTLDYLAIPLLVAGLTLPPRLAIGVSLATVASIIPLEELLVPTPHAPLESEHLASVMLLGLVGVIAVVSSLVHARTTLVLKRHAADLAEAATLLRDASAERIRLLQQISHDLGAPLTPIRLALSVLGKRIQDPADKASLVMVERNARHLHKLVDDVKELALAEGKGIRVVLAPMNLADAVRQAFATLSVTAESRGVRLEMDAPESLAIQGDGVRLLQVLYNLVGNAIKFTPQGGHVRVEAGVDGQEVRVSVHDTGPGLDDLQIANLFRPFSQVHSLAGKGMEDRGTGLGLFISKSIIEAHHGLIFATSAGPGKGSTFTFRLPVTQPAHEPG